MEEALITAKMKYFQASSGVMRVLRREIRPAGPCIDVRLITFTVKAAPANSPQAIVLFPKGQNVLPPDCPCARKQGASH
jgi:hypothetical protein